ncbi:hemerythrin domain-containing protein [Herbidospora galbida]|uniref:Hemerythrin domain-containing protein n=1 Tax=Herbidospora galbida TaxID=2575442 RepID=A0A4U3MP42_9ACTN|nr:hemerythrin domain-containing protein [Herbidospora galbida]TKK89846.1 hemerythrin domain-containing protein [Herbidospora galbida]
MTTTTPDLTAFLAFHRALRRDFGRLADALDRLPADDAPRRALIDDHTALQLRALHHHHSDEDANVWPYLRKEAPQAAEVLDTLEAEHQEMDQVIERLTGPRRPAGEQARDLRRLHDLLNDHLDLEEGEVVPLIREHIPAGWWAESGKEVMKSHGRDLPFVAAWTIDAATREQREHILRTVPGVLRVLYRLSWRRGYERRTAQVFG